MGADGELILSQIARERPAEEVVTKLSGDLSKSAFEKLAARAKIGRMLQALSIPAECSPSLRELASALAFYGWEDGPHAITAVRNAVAHSHGDDKQRFVLDAWRLAQQYLELVLLRLFSFNGRYSNRTLEGKFPTQVEQVPWAK